jgi:hypothetical protein
MITEVQTHAPEIAIGNVAGQKIDTLLKMARMRFEHDNPDPTGIHRFIVESNTKFVDHPLTPPEPGPRVLSTEGGIAPAITWLVSARTGYADNMIIEFHRSCIIAYRPTEEIAHQIPTAEASAHELIAAAGNFLERQ